MSNIKFRIAGHYTFINASDKNRVIQNKSKQKLAIILLFKTLEAQFRILQLQFGD